MNLDNSIMAKFESVITSLSLVVPKGTMLAILVILQSDYQTTRIRGVIKHESVQATRPIDQACLFHLFFHSVFAPPDSSSPAVCLPRLNYSVKRELCEVCLKPRKKKKSFNHLTLTILLLVFPVSYCMHVLMKFHLCYTHYSICPQSLRHFLKNRRMQILSLFINVSLRQLFQTTVAFRFLMFYLKFWKDRF